MPDTAIMPGATGNSQVIGAEVLFLLEPQLERYELDVPEAQVS